MSVKRRRHSAAYKFKVALGAAKGNPTLSQPTRQYRLHPGQMSEQKHQLLNEVPSYSCVPATRRPDPFRDRTLTG